MQHGDPKQQQPQNEQAQGVDKAPGEEQQHEGGQVQQEDLKGKKVDGDPSKEEDQPSH